MGKGVFTDKEHEPTPAEIADALGTRYPLWETMNRFVTDNYRTQREFKCYGRNYGWM